MDPVTPIMQPQKNASFLAKYKFTIISLCIIIVALVPLIMISKNTKKPASIEVTTKVQVTPTVAPLTQQNAVPTLDAVDTKIQTALDQSNQDIQAANQVDSSQDSTTGL